MREGTYIEFSNVGWEVFCDRYNAEVVTGLAVSTATKVDTVFSHIDRILNPSRLREVTTSKVSHFQATLRSEGKAESTIASYLAHLKAALRWAVRVELLHKAPEIVKPKRAKSSKVMKGRPITGEEFDRMLSEVNEDTVGVGIKHWKHLLRGLWLSGLRLSEAMLLTWDDQTKLRVDLTGRRPMLIIPAELEKGHKDRRLPITPDFYELLATTPEEQRLGCVFTVPTKPGPGRLNLTSVKKTISAIGKAANVKVDEKQNGDEIKVKFASAHDLRRSFGERWAKKVMPQVLMEMMRHESMETTLKFYVGRNADATADVLWGMSDQVSIG